MPLKTPTPMTVEMDLSICWILENQASGHHCKVHCPGGKQCFSCPQKCKKDTAVIGVFYVLPETSWQSQSEKMM